MVTGNKVALLPIMAPFLIMTDFQPFFDPVLLNDGGFISFIVTIP